MRANRRTDTAPERLVRSELHRRGLRFRKDLRIDVPYRRAVRPDIVFTKQRLAVFIDGCFWHGCPDHWTKAKHNEEYWLRKVEDNRRRDAAQTEALMSSGWRVLRIWEHTTVEKAADEIAGVLADLKGQ